MTKASRKSDLAQVKKQLAILKRKGLYKPKDGKAKPTRYAMQKLKTFKDVIAGNATVLKASAETIAREKDRLRTTRGRIVIRNQAQTTYSIDKRGNLVTRRKLGEGKLVSRRARLIGGQLEPLKAGQYYELPIRHGRVLRYRRVDDINEMMAIVNEYRDGKAPFDALKYVNIATRIVGDKYRIAFLHPETGARRQRTVHAYDDETAIGAFREFYPEFATAIVTSVKPA